MFPKFYTFSTSKSIFLALLSCCFLLVLTSFNLDDESANKANLNADEEECNLTLTVENQGECPLHLYEWLQSGDVFEAIIQPGESYSVETEEDAMWRVTNGDFNNLVYDENIIATLCPEETWVTFPVYCNPPMTSWDFDCNSGEKVEIVGEGINNDIPHSLFFDNSSNIYKTVVEVVYKGGNPGSQIVIFDNDGNPFSAYREAVPGSSSNVWVYRTTMPGTPSASIYNQTNQDNAQSMVAYLFRENVPSTEQSGVFTYLSGYNNLETMTFDIPVAAEARDIVLTVPISELTDDGRYLLLEASAGGVSNQTFVYGPSNTLGCCLDLVEVVLNNVPATATQVTLNIDTRHNQNGQSVNGQSYVLAGAVEIDGECTTTPPTGASCELNDHGADSGSETRLLWLNLPGESPEISRYSVVNNSSNFVENNDGTALITGTAENINDPSYQWQYNVRLINKRNWTEWSALGRSYKDANNTGAYPTWSYYEVDNSDSYFTGLGGHAGQSLMITHNPGDFEFGFQVGTGANDKNANYGLSGWFSFSGAFEGNGDFNGNLENCGLEKPECTEFEGMKSDANFGQNNGKIVVTSLDRAANYRLFLNGNLIAENEGASYIISDLAPGTYTVLAKGFDSQWGQGCEKPFTFTINEVGGNNDCEITPPFDLNLTCTDDLSPDFTGYPSINCDNGGSCARTAGYHELNYEVFAGSTSEWSFDQGWQIGSGCTPSCGLAPNAFIDFTNFQYSYDRSLTSPVFDACCMDNIQIDYCVRSDLFTNDYNNAPIQYLDVQYKIGNGSWTTINTYESENGATNDFNEEDLNIPGAAGAQLRIRFRARGNGGSFTLGGWGVDRLRVEGYSSGCSTTLSPSDYDLTYSDDESGACPKVIVRTWTATPNNSVDNCTPSTLVKYDMDACTSFGSDGSNYDYSEFTPTYPNAANCVNVSASGVYRNSGAHSCIAGQGGSTAAACFGVGGLTSFHDNSSKAIRFEVTIDPADAGRLTALKFHEMAPDYFDHLSGNSGTNNYPQKYGVRVLKNGVEVFKQININTTQSWSLESFDFSNNPNFEILSTSTFQFELLSYDAIGNGGQISAWDLDNIRVEGCCGSGVGSDVLTTTQIITVNDQTAPDVANIPANVTIECNETEPIVAPTFIDICDNDLDIIFAENIQTGLCDDNYTIVRTWTATDDCGNARTATQLITLIDSTDPVFSDLPNNMTAECDAVPAPVTLTATDNCDDDVLVSFNENRINGSCEDNYQLERIWIATDNCGNTVSHTQIITVSDMTPPVFEPLADVTLECSDDLTAPSPVANDNCDTDVMIILNDEFTSALSCTDNYTITRIWTATDNCGNQSTLTQVATVQDTQAPTISVPADQTVECDALPAIPTPIVNDNCDNDVLVNFNEAFVPGSCDNSFTLIRTWTADDNCGNSATATQTITVQDTQAPTISVPADQTVSCDALPAIPTPIVNDNCDNDVLVNFNEAFVPGSCDNSFTLIRTWNADDNCGNSATATQTITVVDTENPTLTGVPADETVQCDAVPFPGSPTASDNCDNDVDITFQEISTQTADGSCTDNSYTLTRIWTATDNCGNVETQQQVITVEDTTDPVLGNLPSDETVECDAIPAPATLTADDNCDNDVAITFAENSTKTNNGSCTDDTYVITRTWTATDNCGNTDTYSQTINVQDTTDPMLQGVPVDETVECDEVPAPGQPTADDNCDTDVEITFVEVREDGNCEDNYTLTRTWTATDNCGNTDVQVQVITVQDTTDPELVGVPANLTIECNLVPTPGQPTAIDNCDADVDITFAEVSVDGNCEDNYTLERTWTATDNCGNSVSQTQIITVQDTTDPQLIGVPADVTIECDLVSGPAVPQAIDNCDNDVDITFVEVRTDGNCEDNYTLTRTWTATDNCGNIDVQVQVITVQDTSDPNIYDIPADVTVECDAIPAPSTAPFANDNCDDDVTITFVEVRVDGNCEDNYTLERTWTATDNCGNTDSGTQTITVQDTTHPMLSGVPADETVECDAVPNPAFPTASDNCDNDVDITYEEVRTDGNCEDNYTLTRTWTATDNCGNTDVQVQVITVQDTTDPILSGVPADATVECDAVPAPAQPTADDNCDVDVEITFAEVRVDGNCEDNYTLERTWTATDNCGNSVFQTQIITVQDTTDPNLYDVPANITVECDAVPAPSIAPYGDDNCDADVDITFAEVRVDGNCEDNYTLERTWTATDNCGNSVSQTQIITVQDTTDPQLIGVPADVTIECDLVSGPAVPQAIDNCDNDVDITFVEVRTDGNCEDNYTLTRTWTATDNCGNTDVQVQVITVQDTSDPNIYDIPVNVTVECDAIPAPSTAPFANDNCDNDVTITFVEVRVDGNCEDNYTLERTWTATDNCGNTDSGTQIITVQDTTDPMLQGVPGDETVECDAVPNPAFPTASDNCDNDVDITYSEVRTDGNCEDNYTLTRTWTATDNCGNTDVQVQVITVQDTTDPVLSGVPTNTTVECDAVPAPAQPTADDNCDTDVTIDFQEVRTDGNCTDNYTLTRTWTATDNCGNTDVQVQVITVQDTTDPNLYGVPANITVECDAVPSPSTAPYGDDICDDDVEITFAEVKVDGNCEDNYTLERTWTATDNCGNATSQTQIITVQDTTDPQLVGVPDDVTIECDLVPAPAAPQAIDNCDNDVDITFNEVRTDGNCEDNYTLTRTWTATDNCGNTDVQVQVITVQDTSDPVIYDIPADVTVECDAIPAPSTAPFANDNCDDDVTITFVEVRVDGNCEDNYTLERTWTATDNCGNTDSGTQIITVQDTTDPVLAGIPANETVECDAIPAPAQPTASDNCDADVTIVLQEVITDGNCTDNYTITRTWTATDNCGNQDVGVQVITVQDTTDPELFGVPSDVTVECDAIPAPATPIASDNCDLDVNIAFEVEIVPGTCPDSYLMIRKWTATDNCGNQDIQIQNITVQDTTDPTLIGVPANVTVECDAIPALANPTAEDNCDPNPIVTFNEVKIDGPCVDSYTLERTWTATDACGNDYSETQIITVQDTTDPVMAGIPADVTVECDLVPSPAQPFVNDNCDVDVDIDYTEVRTDGNCDDNYTLTRTWTATDNCGNSTTQVQIITVQDTTDPALYGVPDNITVQCDAIPLPASPTANDNCDTDVEISFLENITPGACTDNYTITRTWTATDNCGNETIGVQIITVQDTTDPVLSGVPGNITVECDAIPAPAQPTANDNCDTDVEITFTEVQLPGVCENTYNLSRIWVAKDNCGNTTSATQIITVQDTTDPIMVGVPADVTVECDAVPTPAQPTATDNCDVDVVIDYSEVRTDGACEDTYTLTRTWTATDNCGNTDSQVQVIEVQDTTDPILSGVPADATVECNAIPVPAQPTATDNCDVDVTITFDENIIDGSCADNYTITRTWTATDNCGNSVSQTQTLTIQDNVDPIIAGVPADVTVECNAVPAPAQPTATDNCDADVDLDYTEVRTDGSCADNYTLTRTWIATDNCGNTTTEIQVITVQDTTDPILSGVPADITVECDAIPVIAQPTATDNCDVDVNIEFIETIIDGNCADNYTIERTWVATDNCGNAVTQTQVITVQDTTDPIMVGVPGNATVECDAIPLPLVIGVDITATDNCDTDVSIELVEEVFPGSCSDNYTILRTYTATDNCGNEDVQFQIITVEDTTPPTISGVPADITAECDAVPAAPAAGTIIINDNCDADVAKTFSEIIQPGSCADSYLIKRIWTATDNCGNVTVATQNITVSDVTPPTLIGVPADAQVDCNSVPAAPAPGSVTATDNCDVNVFIQYFEELIDGPCDDSYILKRTWTAIDNCGNETIATQTITVGDATGPVLAGIPADVEVECNNIPAPANPIATDDCDTDVDINFVETITPGACENSFIITRAWIAIDNCGNETVGVQNITVQDTQAPILAGIPTDTSADCNSVPAPPANVTATDNCDTDVTIDFSETSAPGACANSTIITRTWTAIDNCGNSVSATQTISVGDASAPVLANVPSDVTVECNAVPAIATNITATDNCDTNPLVSFNETNTPGDCTDSYTLTRTWTATDACGNETSESQIITVQDTTDPVIAGVPADVTIDCNNVPAPAMPFVNDNCDTDVDLDFDETSVANGCGYIITRTWTATDNCGNSVAASQILTVNADAPVLSNLPADLTVECDNIPVPATVTATSDCLPNIQVDFAETIIDGACTDSYTIERTWTTNAGCGTAVSHTQIITVQDTTDPILANVPSNVTVECNAVPAIATNITATDNCDTNPLVSFGEILTPGACENSYTLTRTWTATDNCGNEISQSQIITVEDNQDPIIAGVPADVTVGCDQVPAPAMPFVNDNCDTDVDLDFNEVSVADGCGYILTRTWTATDNCGNTVSASQTITVNSDTPVLSGTPADLTVECNNIPAVANVTANSNCDPNIVIWFMENIIPGSCEDTYTIERIWTIDLACGNDVSYTQTITVQDIQAPILAGIPADLNVACGSVPAPAQPVATDNCDTDVDISFSEIQNPLSCGYELVRTWTATDNCGNETSASQTITVEDNEDPILIGIPADATAECDNIPLVAANVTVTDNCSTNITIDFVETTTPGACTNAYTLTRTWTATDDCGNTVSASQNIEVGDNTPPTLIDVPANITVECAAIPGAPYVGATDNCDFDVQAILTEVETPLACGYLITRTWTVTDDCGNESTATQEVTVADSTPPELWEIPADVTVECGNIPAIDPGVGVMDNCDPNATLDFTESYIAGSCAENFIIVRTWTATDNCGNTVSDAQHITVEDTQAPVLAGIPTDLTVDCNNVPTPAQPVATDNCDSSVDIDFDEISVANGCGYILTRTWTATDNCGNVTEASQTITVNADAPVLSDTPADVTVECNNIPTAAIITAQSICAGTVQVDFVENIIPGSCENSYTIERTWSIPSGCGNAISHTQLITVEDTQAPILAGIPADLNVGCGNVPSPAQPVATDNCDTDVDISFNEIQNPLSCGYELVRTWTATDNCGNETSASQIITVQDNDAPILIGVPADEVVNCGTVPNPATVTASDNCDNDVVVDFSETSVVDGCQTIITRTWTAIDDCGNESSESQTITINSDPATLSAMPADFTVECSNVPAPADISAFDGCTGAPVPLDFVENIIPGACENSYTIERTWSVSSGCGVGVSHTQYITVEDTTDPILIGVPADVDVNCGMIPTAPIVTATDNCDTAVEILFNEVETPAACGYILTRTWTATDNCGNEVSASQNIHVGDNTPPIVAGIPADLTVECNNIPVVSNTPIATDNCDLDVEISFNETNTPGACADSYTLTRTWTAIDDCGNVTEGIQTIFVQDTTDPTLIGIPSNLTVDLTLGQTIPTAPMIIGSDNCDTDVEITFVENQTGSGCSYTLERTWTATDNCGNEVSATQTIEVIGGLNVTETHVDASCGENNGSIDLTVNGGVAPITFVWSNGVGNIEDQTDLAPGIYEVIVTDGTGCSANLSIEIIGTGALQVDISATMVSCFDGNDGSINITMVNGLAPFTYNWTGGIGNTPNPTNLTAGSYNVTITDANGCSVSTAANVNQPQELTLIIDSNGGGCAGALGSATANVDGGTPAYQYAWSNGETTTSISDLDAGTYIVTVTDNNGCTIEDEVTISMSSNLVVSIDKTDVTCYLDNDGTATASATGGQPDLTYLWSNGETNANIINLEAGFYTVTVTDGTGCTGTQTIEIISPPELQLTTVATEVSQIGNDGTATVTATGGTLPYNYIWSNGQMTPTITGLSVGTYSVTVIDDNGCFAVDQVEVNSSVPLGDVNIGDYVWFDTNRDGIQDPSEVGFNNVMVKLLTAGQDGTFGTLDDEIVATETTGFNPTMTGTGYYLFENVLPGTYQIEFMASSLPNDYVFSLANQGTDDNLDSDADLLTGRTPTFTVVAGQMDDLSFDAGIHPECNNVNTGGAIEATQTICAGETPDLIVNSILPMGGGGDLEYIWLSNTTGSPFSNTDPSWTIIQGATDEFYQPGQISITTYFIRCVRRAGCTNYVGESNIVAILVTPLPAIGIEEAPTSLCLSEETSFQATYAGVNATYFWDFGDGASPQTSMQRNVYNLTYSSTGIKTVTLTVEDMGCSISITYEFEVINCLNNFVFTNFSAVPTPNNTEALLNWTTRYEVNNSRYYLEHSKNGDDFEVFELRNANGSAQEYNSYQAVHAEPYYGVNYYRVKYVDANNDVTYSKVEVVVFDNGTRDIHVYPNPVVDFTYVEFLTELTEDATIEVVDMAGRVLSTQVVADGFRTYRVNLADYPAGTYLIWVRYNDYRKDVERVVKITE